MISSNYFVDIHTHQLPSSDVGLLSIYNWIPTNLECLPPKSYYSMGIHPWYIKEDWKDDLSQIEYQIQTDSNLLAIGETGLDNLIKSPIELQERVFIAQIELAQKYQKPLIVHCVKAHERLLDIIREVKPSVPVIIHGFNQKWNIAEKLLQADFYLSFGNTLSNQSSNASICIQRMALDGLFFLETDNKSSDIESIYIFASQRLGADIEKLKLVVQSRFKSIFNTIN